MPKIRDSDSENDKDKSGDNTFATNHSFRFNSFITFIYTLSISFLTLFCIKLSNKTIRVSDVPTTSSISLNFRTKIRNSFSLSFCRFTKCVIINPVIVIINSAV